MDSISYLDRIQVFNDTLEWIKQDSELSASVQGSIQNSKVYYEDDYPEFDQTKTCNQQIIVSPKRSFKAAMDLAKKNQGARIAVMNFANAFEPGGGVKVGASAQEESLCRCSTLYSVISDKSYRDTYYKHHETLGSFMASDSLIYSPDIIICKSDAKLPQRLDRVDWTWVDIITIAAPDLRISMFSNIDLDDKALFDCHKQRITHLLNVAAAQGADILVLGAFGCGAFQNDPQIVAKAFKSAIAEFPPVFQIIEFAVFTTAYDSLNFDAFKAAFS